MSLRGIPGHFQKHHKNSIVKSEKKIENNQMSINPGKKGLDESLSYLMHHLSSNFLYMT